MPDANGYPTEPELQAILEFTGTPLQFVDYIQSIWWHDYYSTELAADSVLGQVRSWKISTAGWSGNEEIIGYVERTFFHFFYWHQSTRGGHYEFRIPVEKWDKPFFLGEVGRLPAGGA